ncbi:MAG: hydantoinase/oxoprolinase family protein [Gordonia sp. (in: high G+C Gram-positive bacteria)]
MKRLKVAVDIGGTFVDAIAYDVTTGEIIVHKVSTTPEEPARGVLEAVDGLMQRCGASLSDVESFAHGTTLGLNAILQRNGARVGLITNEGFRDVLEIARAAIPFSKMYDFSYQRPAPLVARRLRLGVPGRMDALGAELIPLDGDAVMAAAHTLIRSSGVESIAICFLHSYANPIHENQAAARIRQGFPGVEISVSNELSREYREYERTSTTVLDAYIRPVLNGYLAEVESALRERGLSPALRIMRSGGGAMTSDLAKRAPLTTVLSGPAGGVVGTTFLARALTMSHVLSFDVGGTSVDSCVVVDGSPGEVHESEIDGLPLQVPIFDIRTIGAGGGSIARMDGDLLKVGPRSAGAVPGPAAYQKGGTEPTVTDAAFVLGYLDTKAFLGGEMDISADAAGEAIRTRVAGPMNIDLDTAAVSILRILIARTVGALREITIERGLDPREFTLLAFGGAGPLLGPLLARELGVAATMIPRSPAAFSAYGMLMSDVEFELAQTRLEPLDATALADLEEWYRGLEEAAQSLFDLQEIDHANRVLVRTLDVRYRGQEHTLPVQFTADVDDIIREFTDMHRQRHGHAMVEPCEIVSMRVRAIGIEGKPALVAAPFSTRSTVNSPESVRQAYDFAADSWVDMPVYNRAHFRPSDVLAGPAIVEEATSTTVLFGDQTLMVDDYGHLIITAKPEG